MRFISAQFEALLSNDCWKRNANHSNAMAKLLERELIKIPQVQITQRVDANGVFVTIPPEIVPRLQQEHFFYIWTEKTSEARVMCSFDTSEKDILDFADRLKKLLDGLQL
jgi:threonine aldolase